VLRRSHNAHRALTGLSGTGIGTGIPGEEEEGEDKKKGRKSKQAAKRRRNMTRQYDDDGTNEHK
jgi:hypothetical protein